MYDRFKACDHRMEEIDKLRQKWNQTFIPICTLLILDSSLGIPQFHIDAGCQHTASFTKARMMVSWMIRLPPIYCSWPHSMTKKEFKSGHKHRRD
jgi:hypothetical protein